MLFESLERRSLMSASPVSAQVAIDRLEVKADLLKFRLDIAAGEAMTLSNIQKLKAAGLKGDATLTPLFTKFHQDVKSMHQQLFSDRLAESENVLSDQIVIVKELVQILKDKGNSSALTTDHTALLADRVQLQNDEITGLNTRIATREADFSELTTDLNNIVIAAKADPSLTAAELIDVNTFASDRATLLTTLMSDLQTIQTARTTLSNALAALET
jgi:hypothetical protein